MRLIVLTLLVLAAAGAVTALWPLRVVSAITGRGGYSLRAGVDFGNVGLQLDVYTPDSATASTPVVVFFHGGGWAIGDKDEYRFVGQALTSSGLIVVAPNYRLSPAVTFPAFLADGAEAVAWAAKNLSGHPLFLAGHSAGAHIAALLNLDEHYLADAGVAAGAVAGTIGLSGPYDFLPLTEGRYKRVFPATARAASQPINFVDGDEPPMLLVTGDTDSTVSPDNTARLAARIATKGGSPTVRVYPGVGHLGTMLALARVLPYAKPPVIADIVAFIKATSPN